ncbi:hypothetical protein EDC65_5365 [Stella humosa]|uniref:Tetratricopeptide repeat protein n=1 Tax=Stella humosa TaxID=94 RepID=A0A3N1KRN2_9PROT|nr:hypothetical protein [Stella humosa]ROP81030.1 hypothetical protein EDC65_5365 [Stella humosa]BBK29720.1 hypothetical protein STHU_03540 [Stella humosa]
MDLTTLGYALLFGLSVFTADSVIYADSYSLRVELHEDVRRSGYTRQYVENYFAFEMKRMFRHESTVKNVAVRAAGEASVTSALAEPLGADKLRAALQNLFQVDPLGLEIYLLPAGDDIRAIGFGSRPSGAFFEFATQAGGRQPQEFLGDVAMRAALMIDAYHARLAQARMTRQRPDGKDAGGKGLDGKALDGRALDGKAPGGPVGEAKPATGILGLQRLAAELAERPQEVDGAPPRDDAELTHLEAVVAFRIGDMERAEMLLKRALARDPGMVAAQANLALVNLLRGRHLPSLALAREAESALAGKTWLQPKAMRMLRGSVYATAAFNAEAVRQPKLAETLWQRACADLPQLGHLLAEQGGPWLPGRSIAACWKSRDRDVLAGYEGYGWELLALAPMPAPTAPPAR